MNVPDWLKLRDGNLRPGLNDTTWLVLLNEHPQYRLVTKPANGNFTCSITQTNNGKRLDGGLTYQTSNAAFTGGLQELREKLGW